MQRELLEQHSRNPAFSDVTFVSGISGERIPGHRIIQASSSQYFAELFSKNPEKKVFQLPRPIEPITQPYVFDKSLIPQELTEEQKPEKAPEAEGENEEAPQDEPTEENKKEEKVNAAKLLGIGVGKLVKSEKDDMKGLNERPPATLDPTRSILSLTYILPKTQEQEVQDAQNNPLAQNNSGEQNKFQLLNRLSPPITPQNCLIFYSLARSLTLKTLENQLLEYISQYLLTPTSSCALYLESSKFDIPGLKAHALEIITNNFNDLLNSDRQKKYLLRLSYDYFKELISRDDLWIDSEDKILDLVIDYMKEREVLQRRLEDIKEVKKNNEKAPINAEQDEGAQENAEDDNEEENEDTEGENEDKPVEGEGDEPKEEPKVEEETHKNFMDLEKEASKRMKRFKLSEKEKKDLLLLLRYKFISHERLLTASKVYFLLLPNICRWLSWNHSETYSWRVLVPN